MYLWETKAHWPSLPIHAFSVPALKAQYCLLVEDTTHHRHFPTVAWITQLQWPLGCRDPRRRVIREIPGKATGDVLDKSFPKRSRKLPPQEWEFGVHETSVGM